MSRDTRTLRGQISTATFLSGGQLYTHSDIGTVQLLQYTSLQSSSLQYPNGHEARGLLPARYAELVLHSQGANFADDTHQDLSRLVVHSEPRPS